MNFLPISQQVFLGNTVEAYSRAFLIVVLAALLAKLFKFLLESRLERWAKKTPNKLDDLIVEVILRPIVFLTTLIGLYFAIDYLELAPTWDKWLKMILHIIIVVRITFSVAHMAGLFVDYYFQRNPHLQSNPNLKYVSKKIASVVLWLLVIVLIITNLGYNLNSILAGLGIGGIAVALAAQSFLSDLFGSISIFMDRPFQIGDFIVVGTNKGTVKSIGMKTTRITTLQGEELVMPNATLINSEIQNFRKMKERRICFQFGVLYETPLVKLRKIPKMIEAIITQKAKCTFERAHFALFAPSSLDFEVVYYIKSGDYIEYMDIQQAINLEIMEKFAKEKIEFAYPTQKVFVAK